MTTERLQVRATFEDTKKHQTDLFGLLRKKIRLNEPLTEEEKKTFPDLVANALLSQSWRHCYYTTNDNIIINLGSTRYFSLTLLDIDTKEVIITERRLAREYVVEIGDLWNILYDKCKELSQPALEEAIHMSKESPKREAPTSFDFIARKEQY
jgi:hypothetical protein